MSDLNFLSGMGPSPLSGERETPQTGFASLHLYLVNAVDDSTDYFYNADGELLVVPEVGQLLLLYRNGPSSTSHRARSP